MAIEWRFTWHGIPFENLGMPPGTLMSHEAFMRHALHDPRTGYYARKIQGIGRRGDFTTAPMLGEALAQAVAGWADRALKECRCRNLIEIGPGEGLLMAGVRARLPWITRLKTRIHLVETSEPLREIQQHRLGKSATWHATPEDALAACHGQAVIFSNELVDAFPVRRFRHTAEGWIETGVRFGAGGTAEEVPIPGTPLPESSIFALPHRIGQHVETHESYREWLERWLPHWKSGRMLTIDYGAEAPSLYQRRPAGSLRGYLLQQRVEGLAIYQNIGRQDLTADVNFTDLMDWSRPWMSQQHLQPLSAFLAPTDAGPFGEIEGAGGAFQVLDERRLG